MTLIGQIIVAIISIVCLLLRYYFKDLSRKASRSERKKFDFISVFMTIATAAGLICTVFLISEQLIATGQDGNAFFKIFFVGFIVCEIINYKNDDLRDGLCQFLAIMLPALVAVIALVPAMFEWDSNINKAETQKYSQEQFELVDVYDDIKSDISINVQTSISKYFKYEVEQISQSSEEVKETTEKKQTYEICYLTNETEKQQLFKTIDFDDTALKPLPEGQKPYMIVKTYTSYSINNNVDPPEECDFKYSYKYELYVPEEDIDELSKLLK